MEGDVRSERSAPESRAARFAPAWSEAGFAMGTKAAVLVSTAVAVSLVGSSLLTPLLTGVLLAYLAVGGQRAMAFKLLVAYAVLGGAYLLLIYLNARILVFSPVHLYAGLNSYPVMVAACAVALSPPGLISAALARARVPKKLIVGALVLLRFPPTVRSSIRRLRESCRRRGVLSLRCVTGDPVQAFEHVLVPLMFSLIDSADRLSSSAVARAAEAPTQRTSYYRSPLRRADAACLALFAAALAACVWLSRGV